VFSADDGSGNELWSTNGATAQLVADLNPNGGSYPDGFLTIGTQVFFSADDGLLGREIWMTDGTTAGTVNAGDIRPGAEGSYPSNLIDLNGAALMVADDGVRGAELWLCAGPEATVLFAELIPGPAGAAPRDFVRTAAGDVVFAATLPASGAEPFIARPGGAQLLADLWPGANGSNPVSLRALGNELWCQANDGALGDQPWRVDAATGAASLVRDLGRPIVGGHSSYPYGATALEQTLLFAADDLLHGYELWRSDGTSAGTYRVIDIAPGVAGSDPNSLTACSQGIAFAATNGTAGSELWFSDGTIGGTYMIDARPGPDGVQPSSLVAVGNRVFFAGLDANYETELWVSDGTAAGTVQVADVNPGGSSYAQPLCALNGQLVFAADDGSTGTELWISDGTTTGTIQLADIRAGGDSSYPYSVVALGTRAVFIADDGVNGRELWVTNGTPAGTALLLDLRSGPASADIDQFVLARDRAYFTANDGVTGYELWVTDGTVAGTRLVRDVFPGPGSGAPRWGSVASVGQDRTVVFAGTDGGVDGLEVWRSDGTAANTTPAASLVPGAVSASPFQFARAGTKVFFKAVDPATGTELWSLPIAATRATVAEPFGVPCAGLSAPHALPIGLPSAGNLQFGIALDQAPPTALALLVLGLDRGNLPIGCTLYAASPTTTIATVTNGVGSASLPAGIPNVPAFVGQVLVAQWGALSPGGPALGTAVLSNGLFLVVGG
jgi:ELWxxDGT repeat protein